MFKNRRAWVRRFFLWVGILTAAAAAAGAHAMAKDKAQVEEAMFGAGCFWGVEKILSHVPGVIETRVGYAGGNVPNPSYEAVCTGQTGHAEVVHLKYDPTKVGYVELLAVFWKYHDPTTMNRQGPDIGSQYRSVVFTYGAEQARLAKSAVQVLNDSGLYPALVVTEVLPAAPFYAAEGYHQKYLEKNPHGYCSHRLLKANLGEVLLKGLAAAENS
jgi:peptide-methionine (S)-S-oxide reductase